MGCSRRVLASVAGIGMLVMTGDFRTTAQAQAPARAAQAQASAAKPPNLNGVWTRTRSVTPKEPLPLNKRGLALREAIDESLTPIYDCVPETVPHILGDPYNFSFEQLNDRVVQRFEKDATVRTLWLEGHHRGPSNNDYGVHGYSMAHYEGDTLVVVTTKYTFEVGGIEDKQPMASSSTLKKVTERYSRKGDQLVADVTLEDKLMLTEPIKFLYEFKPTKDALVEWPDCDQEEARKPMSYVPVDQLKYGVR